MANNKVTAFLLLFVYKNVQCEGRGENDAIQ